MATASGTFWTILIVSAAVGGTYYLSKAATQRIVKPLPPWESGPPPPRAPRLGKKPVETSGTPEALAWLSNNPNPNGFASNHFQSIDGARAMVQQLYQKGATKVRVTRILGEDWRIQSEGGPYANTLLVTLPRNTLAADNVRGVLQYDQADKVRPYGKKKNILLAYWD